MPDHEDVDGVLALNDEAVALVQRPGAAALQDVQPERAVCRAGGKPRLEHRGPDSPPLRLRPEVEVLDPHRTLGGSHRDRPGRQSVHQDHARRGRLKRREEALPHPDRVEAPQALQVGPEHHRPELGDPLGVAIGRLAQ